MFSNFVQLTSTDCLPSKKKKKFLPTIKGVKFKTQATFKNIINHLKITEPLENNSPKQL